METPFRRVVLGGEDVGLADAVPVEGRVEDRLHEVAVREVVGPVPLALEAAEDGVVAEGLLAEADLGQPRVADHQVAGDHGHLDRRLPVARPSARACAASPRRCSPRPPGSAPSPRPGRARTPPGRRSPPRSAARTRSCRRPRRACRGSPRRSRGRRSSRRCPSTTPPSERYDLPRIVATASPARAKRSSFSSHVRGDGGVADVLHVAPVDAEGRQALLVVGGQHRREVDGAGALGAVEAPDRLGQSGSMSIVSEP